MISESQISKQIAELANSQNSVDDFEEWFRIHSRNVHSWGDRLLLEVVFSIEAVLSEYHFADLDEDLVKQELANAIRPFERLKRVGKTVPSGLKKSSSLALSANPTPLSFPRKVA
jgi:hypothetical protein